MSNAIPTTHRPNLHHCELHITYACQLRCVHCSNNITEAPSNETMSVERIREFLTDSVRLKWSWEWLVLHGGEPSSHPQLREICEALAVYKRDHNHGVRLYICTNGFGEAVQIRLAIAVAYGIGLENSKKTGEKLVAVHRPLHVSPLDMGEDYQLGCFQSSSCGIAFNNHGFYECSPAASGQRIFGYEPLATRLEDVTEELLMKGYHEHCKHCGYARLNEDANPGAALSTTWQKASDAYKANRQSNET